MLRNGLHRCISSCLLCLFIAPNSKGQTWIFIPYYPWYIHLYIWLICMVNVGKYTVRPMDPMGIYDSRLQTSISQHLQAIGRLMACSKEITQDVSTGFFGKCLYEGNWSSLPQCFLGEESAWKKKIASGSHQPDVQEFGPKESPVKCTTGLSFIHSDWGYLTPIGRIWILFFDSW